MPTGLLPDAAPAGTEPTDPTAVTETFLEALAAADLPRAMGLLADDVDYVNVGLPRIRGRDRVARALGGLERPGVAFEAYLHSISADGPVVLTERTDVIVLGPVRLQFWVWGRFDVHDGRITLWRDSFDFLDMTKATVRGLAGAVVPAFRPGAPRPGDPPGR
jgi:limonene-1,2-epoxide hydrolase